MNSSPPSLQSRLSLLLRPTVIAWLQIQGKVSQQVSRTFSAQIGMLPALEGCNGSVLERCEEGKLCSASCWTLSAAASRRDQFPSKGLALIQNCPAHGDSGCRCQQLAEVLLGSTGAMASPSTILDATMLCRQIFKSATQYPRVMDQEWAENRLADFKLWAKGAGALAPGKASLDHRLASSAETHSIILNLLVMLSMLMEDCIAAATNNPSYTFRRGLGPVK